MYKLPHLATLLIVLTYCPSISTADTETLKTSTNGEQKRSERSVGMYDDDDGPDTMMTSSPPLQPADQMYDHLTDDSKQLDLNDDIIKFSKPSVSKRFNEFVGKRSSFTSKPDNELSIELISKLLSSISRSPLGKMRHQSSSLNAKKTTKRQYDFVGKRADGQVPGMPQSVTGGQDTLEKRGYAFVGKRSPYDFVGKRSPYDFVGKRNSYDFVGKRNSYDFVGKRSPYDFVGKRSPYDFVGKRSPYDFVGKRGYDFVGKRSPYDFVGKRSPYDVIGNDEINFEKYLEAKLALYQYLEAMKTSRDGNLIEQSMNYQMDETAAPPDDVHKRQQEAVPGISDKRLAELLNSNRRLRKRISKYLLDNQVHEQYPEFIGK